MVVPTMQPGARATFETNVTQAELGESMAPSLIVCAPVAAKQDSPSFPSFNVGVRYSAACRLRRSFPSGEGAQPDSGELQRCSDGQGRVPSRQSPAPAAVWYFRLPLELKAVFLDDGVGEDLAGDAIDLGLRVFAADARVERDLEVLALAQIVDALVPHFLQRAVNGFALRVEDTFLERDVDVGFHVGICHYSESRAQSAFGRSRLNRGE